MEIKIIRNENPKAKPDSNSLGFGKFFTDHMFIMDHDYENGWHNARIVPYGNLSLSPASTVLHYGEEVYAYVIVKEGETMTTDELRDYMIKNIARHKVPRYIDLVTSFPMNAAGKILKYKMREEAEEKIKNKLI